MGKIRYNSILKQLKRYAHRNDPTCDINRCPTLCAIHDLDLDTMLAWDIVDTVEDEELGHRNARLESLTFIIAMHKPKYPELYKIIQPIRDYVAIPVPVVYSDDEDEDDDEDWWDYYD